MASRGFYYSGHLPKETTIIDFHPGIVNTNNLLKAFGKVGIDIELCDSTFKLATEEQFANPGNLPKYYEETKEMDPAEQACDENACIEFYEYLDKILKDSSIL